MYLLFVNCMRVSIQDTVDMVVTYFPEIGKKTVDVETVVIVGMRPLSCALFFSATVLPVDISLIAYPHFC